MMLTVGVSSISFAQPDSVVITGRVLNLTAALYRQAPAITFTRNNILQPQSELARQAPLQADGTFQVTMPLIYPQEEVYLDYGGKVYTTFLAAPGRLQLSFDADSMFKAKRLFYFSGVNAEANNKYMQYVMEEDRIMKANKRYGENFFETFWNLEASEALRALDQRAQLRLSALKNISQKTTVPPQLQEWIETTIRDEKRSALFEHALVNVATPQLYALGGLPELTQGILTFQRVQWMIRVGDYADRLVEQKEYQYPTKSKSLKVETMAELIKRYVPLLSTGEIERLNTMIQEGSATTAGLDFLNTLYARNRRILDLVTQFEKQSSAYADKFSTSTNDLLAARWLVQRFYRLSLPEQSLLYSHIRSKIEKSVVRYSLDELYQLEVKDSTYIRLIEKRTDLNANPTEVLSGIWLAESASSGKSALDQVEALFKGKTVYVIKWNLFDDESRNEVLYAPALRAQLPTDVELLYIHLPDTEVNDNSALWKKFIVRHKLKGVHLYLTDDQVVQLLFRLNPLAYPSFGIMKPNGKYASRNAPPPSQGQNAAQAILKVREGR
ncbi:hypothetical protein [Salmonirosea aquatica]|uniref:hypothetical protein n=1 Tax=Salmonirosea aquatica TaxID=2654236 RepID=UPI003570FEFF